MTLPGSSSLRKALFSLLLVNSLTVMLSNVIAVSVLLYKIFFSFSPPYSATTSNLLGAFSSLLL